MYNNGCMSLAEYMAHHAQNVQQPTINIQPVYINNLNIYTTPYESLRLLVELELQRLELQRLTDEINTKYANQDHETSLKLETPAGKMELKTSSENTAIGFIALAGLGVGYLLGMKK